MPRPGLTTETPEVGSVHSWLRQAHRRQDGFDLIEKLGQLHGASSVGTGAMDVGRLSLVAVPSRDFHDYCFKRCSCWISSCISAMPVTAISQSK